MSMPLSMVSLSASPHEPSKTTALLTAIAECFTSGFGAIDRRILMSEISNELGSTSREGAGQHARDALDAVENCDLLVVTTPTYRASYTGLLKHFFDLIDRKALAGTPVFLSATGANLSHSLMIDHQLRPLFSFFQAASMPTGIFAENSDFDGYSLRDGLQGRIDSAVSQAMKRFTA